ncbi:hypothetical protein AB1N83_010031 [Pleurotus pulmonarius]
MCGFWRSLRLPLFAENTPEEFISGILGARVGGLQATLIMYSPDIVNETLEAFIDRSIDFDNGRDQLIQFDASSQPGVGAKLMIESTGSYDRCRQSSKTTLLKLIECLVVPRPTAKAADGLSLGLVRTIVCVSHAFTTPVRPSSSQAIAKEIECQLKKLLLRDHVVHNLDARHSLAWAFDRHAARVRTI